MPLKDRVPVSQMESARLRSALERVPFQGTSLSIPTVFGRMRQAVSRRPGLHVARWPSAVQTAWREECAFGHPFLIVPLLIALGATIWFSVGQSIEIHKLAVLLCVFGMAVIALRHRSGVLPAACIIVVSLLLGMTFAALETARTTTVMLDSPVTTTITGNVTRREVSGRNAFRYSVALRSTEAPRLRRAPKTVTVLVRNVDVPAKVGETITARVRLSPPSGPALPGLNDFAFDSYFKGVGAVGYVYGQPQIVPGGTRPPAAFLDDAWARIAALREAIGMRIRATVAGDAGAIAAALVTAEERAISSETIDALRNSGLGHVLAISGLNMVLAAGTLLVGLRTGLALVPGLAHRVPIKKIAAAGALLMVSFYILISGGAVSAVRSWIMIVIMLIAVFFDRPSISLRNVALAALVVLAVDPSAVTGPGFQMSFAATLALVAGYARWRERKSGERAGRRRAVIDNLRGFFGGLLLSSFIGGISTMIYAAAHFNQLPVYGLLGNLLAMPLIGIVVMPAGLIAMLLMPFGLDTLPLIVMGYGLDVMVAIARFVASLRGQVPTGRIPHLAFGLVAVGGLIACLLRTWLALCGLPLVLAGLLIIVVAPFERPDLVIMEDGRLVALLDGATAATNRKKPPAFIYGQWTRALRLTRHEPPLLRSDLAVTESARPSIVPEGKTGTGRDPPPLDLDAARKALGALLAEGTAGRFSCVPRQWCAATARQGWIVVVVEDRRLIGAACDRATIVVTSASPPFRTCRSGAILASARMLRRSGSLEMMADAGAPKGLRIVRAMDRLDRPWQRHRAYDWRAGTFVEDDPDPMEADEENS